MDTLPERENVGLFDDRYRAFLETIVQVRPRLHRYCARMLGSAMDGEDLVQDALFQAYRKLDSFDGSRPLTPWLFRIAHNLCIDALRRRGVRVEAELSAPGDETVQPVDPPGPAVGRALEHLVATLPPKERACVLLKDVFDYSLEETAALVDSTVGGVKAALNRGRGKLSAAAPLPAGRARTPASAETAELLKLYCERFNRHDWDGVRELVSADARLLFANGYAGRLADAPYFSKYETLPERWEMRIGEVDGEPVVVRYAWAGETWRPVSIVRVELSGNRIVRVCDYYWCPWVLPSATMATLEPASPLNAE
jgi:RNA polymerase sigma-70 factor (ECF subfamily)